MKRVNIKLILLLMFTTLFGNICNAKSINRDSIKLDLFDSVAVNSFINKNGLCEQLNFALQNLDCFIEEDESFPDLIITSISEKSNRSITIPAYDHKGGKVSRENKTDYLSKQVRVVFSEYCE